MDSNYFYSLIQLNQKKKSRHCLKCSTEFISTHSGHRICGICRQLISRQGKMAAGMPSMTNFLQLDEFKP